MLPLFKTYLFDKLPGYFKREDTFKDGNDEGLLERFLKVFGEELDENVSDDIDNYLDIVDAQITPEKFLNLIAYTLGNPPDIFNDPDQYRTILSNVMSVYKVKGTLASYEVLFKMLGFDLVVITELPELNTLYDQGNLYDNDDPGTSKDETHLYDTYCLSCSDYTISFGTSNNAPIDQTTLSILQKAIPFVEPINANLIALIFGLIFTEEADFCGTETITLTNTNLLLYDNAEKYDDGDTYDQATVGTITDIASTCGGPSEGIGFWIIEDDFIVQ